MFNIQVIKNWKFFSLILVLAGLLIVSGCGSAETEKTPSEQKPAASDKPIELKFAHFEPTTNEIGGTLIPGFVKAIEEATNGRVKITIYPGETLLKAKEIYGGVVSGIADIGFTAVGYNPGTLPILEATLIPGHPYDDAAGRTSSAAVWNLIEKFKPAELKDVKLLTLASSASTVIMTAKKPIRTVDELKGVQLRTLGATGTTLKKLGGIPVGMPMPEVKEALSKGILQGNIGGAGPLQTFGLAEYIKYVTKAPSMSSTTLIVVMNGEKWKSLPPDIQKIIEDVCKKQSKEVWSNFFWHELSLPAMEYAKQQKIEIIDFSQEETAKLNAVFKEEQENYAKELDKKGLPGKEIIETFFNPGSK